MWISRSKKSLRRNKKGLTPVLILAGDCHQQLVLLREQFFDVRTADPRIKHQFNADTDSGTDANQYHQNDEINPDYRRRDRPQRKNSAEPPTSVTIERNFMKPLTTFANT